jgi:hypothetical protein
MPRVTFDEYCKRRNQLKLAWDTQPYNFTMLSARQQWDLHEYYRFTELLAKKELCLHWDEMHMAYTSLVQQAGRAYAIMLPYLVSEPIKAASVLPKKSRKGKKDRCVVVRGIVRPEGNIDKLMKVLLDIAKGELARKDEAS